MLELPIYLFLFAREVSQWAIFSQEQKYEYQSNISFYLNMLESFTNGLICGTLNCTLCFPELVRSNFCINFKWNFHIPKIVETLF